MRYPQPGQVKSRLATAIGAQSAATIYDKLVRRTLGVVSDLKRLDPDVEIFVYFTPVDRRSQMEQHYPGPWRFIPQQGTHLGHKMATAFDLVWSRGFQQIVIIGSDIADIESDDIQEAFAALAEGYTVLNPASDGGFYLLGLSRPCPAVFEPETWGTQEIFARTEHLLQKGGLTVRCLRQRHDIDRPEDLSHIARQPIFQDSLSIIIPTLRSITGLRPLLTALTSGMWPGDEIIVVSPEATTAGAPHEPMLVSESCLAVASAKGRGLQLNAGVRHAKGNVLWFVHDDSTVPNQFAYLVRQISRAKQMSLGCFRLAFSPSTPLLNAIAQWGNWRTRFVKLPYGDQGLFCRRETFTQVGGFHRDMLMEDVDFVKRCRRHGGILMLPEMLYTSPQRYLKRGILRASVRNHFTILLYHLGWSEAKLHAFYYK